MWFAPSPQALDTDGSGDISADELAEFMAAKHDMSRADADNLFKSMDTDGDGVVSREEFETAQAAKSDSNSEEE